MDTKTSTRELSARGRQEVLADFPSISPLLFLGQCIRMLFLLLPAHAPRFIYTVIFRFPLLRRLVNTLLRRMIPSSINIAEGIVILNTNDAVVSGALTLGVHEQTFRRVFTRALKEGMTVVDIGANIGYYTLIAARRTGKAGTVIAFEPEPENAQILKAMILKNHLTNVHVEQLAISDQSESRPLSLHPDNKGKHSFLTVGGYPSRNVPATTLPDALAFRSITHVDLIKMDIEGWEGKAFRGMWSLIERDHPTLFFEFAPMRIIETAEDPIAILTQLIQYGYAIEEIDDRSGGTRPIAPDTIKEFVRRFRGIDAYADLYAVVPENNKDIS